MLLGTALPLSDFHVNSQSSSVQDLTILIPAHPLMAATPSMSSNVPWRHNSDWESNNTRSGGMFYDQAVSGYNVNIIEAESFDAHVTGYDRL